MTAQELRDGVLESIRKVAPEADTSTLRPDRPIADQLDLDSFDLLQILVAIHERLGVSIPERDAGRLRTLDELVAYLRAAKEPR